MKNKHLIESTKILYVYRTSVLLNYGYDFQKTKSKNENQYFEKVTMLP
jgi:hypothetical protein